MSDVDWEEEMSAPDVNDSWIFFENRLKNAIWRIIFQSLKLPNVTRSREIQTLVDE